MAGAGDKVGGFSLVRQLGAGGMGETWEAVRRGDHGFEQRVAIKLASRHVLETKEGLELFRREASLAASLRHPNIAAVLDLDERLGYLVYELVDGADLRSVLREAPPGRLSIHVLVYVMAQISRGLAHAHRRVLHGKLSPVVHRDMSPGNVVVDYDGNLKIVDFGIAKATALSERSETIKGKLAYMSPEQITGGVVDGRADQYALGVLAYEAIAGVRPNDGAHDGETLAKILHGDHIPIGKRTPEIPSGLGEIIEHMIAVKPEDRFASMDAVLDALAPFNPPLTTHREVAQLVHRANPPQTIMLRNGSFVSVPVAAPEVLAGQPARTLAGPNLRVPTDMAPRLLPTEGISRPNTPQPRSDIGHAKTMVSDERSPGATGLPLEVAARTPVPTGDLGKPSPYPLLALAALALIGLTSWAVLSGPFAASDDGPGMNGANQRAQEGAAPQLGAPSPTTDAAPISPNPNPSAAMNAIAPTPVAAPDQGAQVVAAQADTPKPSADSVADSVKPDSASASRSVDKPLPMDKPQAGKPPRKRGGRTQSTDSDSDSSSKSSAKVHVRVFPWGRVWIDGKLRGSAPPILEVELSPGSHEIGVGHEKPIETKKVSLAAAEDKSVSFDLEEK
jgi:serine/threonine protein kinase